MRGEQGGEFFTRAIQLRYIFTEPACIPQFTGVVQQFLLSSEEQHPPNSIKRNAKIMFRRLSGLPMNSPQISIHTHFLLTADEIVDYMYDGCQALINDATRGNAHEVHNRLKGFIKTCVARRTSRFWTGTGNERRLVSFMLFGRGGTDMKICDLYSALGYIIAETDHYRSHGNETEGQKQSMHMKMLATYSKWILILHRGLKMQDPAPNTACLIYDPHSESPIRAAVFPNLSGSETEKKEGRTMQQENLKNFFDALGVDLDMNKTTPQSKNVGGYTQYGDCAEILALLYMFDPKTAAHYYLSGMAANIFYMQDFKVYDETKFKKALKTACQNCQLIFRLIDNAPEQRRNLPPRGFTTTQGLQATQSVSTTQFGFSHAHPLAQGSRPGLAPQGSNFFPAHAPAQGSLSGQGFPPTLAHPGPQSQSGFSPQGPQRNYFALSHPPAQGSRPGFAPQGSNFSPAHAPAQGSQSGQGFPPSAHPRAQSSMPQSGFTPQGPQRNYFALSHPPAQGSQPGLAPQGSNFLPAYAPAQGSQSGQGFPPSAHPRAQGSMPQSGFTPQGFQGNFSAHPPTQGSQSGVPPNQGLHPGLHGPTYTGFTYTDMAGNPPIDIPSPAQRRLRRLQFFLVLLQGMQEYSQP
ncbi:hypothetical protein B0H12DRAFT_697008 [Mycena haematopus]|nr:hypothetical protein B0H12DRAFT_697008 [Mycena haematopus]